MLMTLDPYTFALVCSLTTLGRLVRFSYSTTVTKVFVCFHTNTTLLQHFHNMVIILITKKLMPSGVSACVTRWTSATCCEIHTRNASTYRSLMSLPDAAITDHLVLQ